MQWAPSPTLLISYWLVLTPVYLLYQHQRAHSLHLGILSIYIYHLHPTGLPLFPYDHGRRVGGGSLFFALKKPATSTRVDSSSRIHKNRPPPQFTAPQSPVPSRI